MPARMRLRILHVECGAIEDAVGIEGSNVGTLGIVVPIDRKMHLTVIVKESSVTVSRNGASAVLSLQREGPIWSDSIYVNCCTSPRRLNSVPESNDIPSSHDNPPLSDRPLIR
jgi:hypothetical protein